MTVLFIVFQHVDALLSSAISVMKCTMAYTVKIKVRMIVKSRAR